MSNDFSPQKNSSSSGRRVFLLMLFLVPSVLCLAFYYFAIRKPLTTGKPIFKKLAHYGPSYLANNGVDSVFHKIPEFNFINQDGNEVSSKTLKGKFFAVNFFFTSCQTICPKMATQLFRVQDKLHYMRKDFQLISHTVNPEYDTPEILKKYAASVHADLSIWNFVTGSKKELYEMARKGYLVNADEGNGEPDDFVHSELVVLVDKEGCLRGFYDGTSLKDMDRLVDEAIVLAAEYGKFKNNLKDE
jgi:protein SCO1/2